MEEEKCLPLVKISFMTTAEKQALKEKIEKLLQETEIKVKEYEELCRPISPENAIGRVSRMDAINNKSVAEAALRTAKRKVEKLNTALSKLEEPDFGTCSSCKRPINPKRVMLMPESTRCVRCASR